MGLFIDERPLLTDTYDGATAYGNLRWHHNHACPSDAGTYQEKWVEIVLGTGEGGAFGASLYSHSWKYAGDGPTYETRTGEATWNGFTYAVTDWDQDGVTFHTPTSEDTYYFPGGSFTRVEMIEGASYGVSGDAELQVVNQDIPVITLDFSFDGLTQGQHELYVLESQTNEGCGAPMPLADEIAEVASAATRSVENAEAVAYCIGSTLHSRTRALDPILACVQPDKS